MSGRPPNGGAPPYSRGALFPFRGASNLQRPARRVRWKNAMCALCRIWIDRERVVEHRDSPLHLRMEGMAQP